MRDNRIVNFNFACEEQPESLEESGTQSHFRGRSGFDRRDDTISEYTSISLIGMTVVILFPESLILDPQ